MWVRYKVYDAFNDYTYVSRLYRCIYDCEDAHKAKEIEVYGYHNEAPADINYFYHGGNRMDYKTLAEAFTNCCDGTHFADYLDTIDSEDYGL